MRKKLTTAIIIIISSIVLLFNLFIGLLAFYIFVPIKKVSHNIEDWNLLQETNSYLPEIDKMGCYENLEFKYQHRESFIISSDAYILIATYSKENYDIQKACFLDTYLFQDTVTDEFDKKTVPKSGSFLLDGYEFKMLSLEEYDLYYPKYFAFVGFSEEKQEICFVYFKDIELDYISGSFEDFLEGECGW